MHFMDRFSHIDTWVFDLDNTLYDAEPHVFPELGKRANAFITGRLGISQAESNRLRQHYYMTYGTTLRGLMNEHGVEPDSFLRHMHDIDLSPVGPCDITQEYLGRLPGNKIVFTNSPGHFARDVIHRLGLSRHFSAIFAIEDADYWPKPHAPTYHSCFARHGVTPASACMFEDMAVNLQEPHALGMTTVWLYGTVRNRPDEDHPHVHHRAEKLSDWFLSTLSKS